MGNPPLELSRTTRETTVRVTIDAGSPLVRVPSPIFAHFLTALCTTWGCTCQVEATGDVEVDPHHLLEDVGIVLGQALRSRWPGYSGIARYGWALLPMDDALVEVAVDLSGRAGAYLGALREGPVGGVEGEAFAEFYRGLARGGECTLHLQARAGENRHHLWEASFKALGLALRQATQPRGDGALSTKGVIG